MKPNRVSNPFLRLLTLGFTAAMVMAFNSQSVLATNYYWDIDGATTAGAGGATPSGAWTAGGTTWSTDSTGGIATGAVTTALADDLSFSAGTDAIGAYISTLTGTQNAKSLTFDEGTVTVTGGTVNLASGLSNLTPNLATVSSAVTLAGNQTWNTGDAGGITVSGLSTFNSSNTTITRTGAGAGVVTLSGGISLNSSSGTALTLAGTTAANTSLAGGALTFASGASPITVSGTPFTTGNITNNAVSGSGITQTVTNDLVLNAARTFATNTNTNLVISGNVSGGFGLNINPTNNASNSYITLSGNNTYSGNTTVGFATLKLGSATAIGTGSLSTNNNGHFDSATGNDTLTLANGFSVLGSGGMFFDGTNSLTFGGANTFAAQMTVDAIGSNSKNLTLTGTTTMTGSTSFTVNNTGSLVLSGTVDWGAFQLQKSGNGTLVLSTANTGAGLASNAIATVIYPSTIRINAGIVSISTNAAFGTGVVDLRGATLLSTAALTGASKLTNTVVNATGSPTIGGTNNIDLGGAYILSNGANNQTLNITNTGTTTLSGNVSLTDLTGDNQTLSVNVGAFAGASEISGIIQNTTAGTAVGSFTKAGAGLLKLSGANTYTGATTISAGTLQLSGSGAINSTSAITLNGSGAKLLQTSSVASTRPITLTNGTVDGTGTVGAVTAASNFANTLKNGNGTTSALTLGALTFSGSAGVNVNVAGGATTDAPLDATGGLTTTGGSVVVSVSPTAALVAGTAYKLINHHGTYAGTPSTDFLVGNIPGVSARQVTFANDGTNITLTYNGAFDTVKWTGGDDGTWNAGLVGTNKNWALVTAGTPVDFIQGDTVLFDDTATGTTDLTLTGTVLPASTTFDNPTKTYTLAGTSGIGGTGSLTKNGAGAVSIANPNTYTGGTTLNAGTLNINHATALGAGPINIAGGTINNTVGAAIILNNSGSPLNLTGDFTYGGTNDLRLTTGAIALPADRTITTNGTATLRLDGLISGSFGLTKSGPGILSLANGSSNFTGNVVVSGGTLTVVAGGASNGSGSALGVANTGKTITINAGATVNGTSANWFGNASNPGNTNPIGTLPAFVVNGGTLTTTRYTTIGAITLNGGTVTNAATDTGNYQSFSLRGGSVTVTGSTPSTMTAVSPTATSRGYHLNANTLFTVADVTGNANPDLFVSAPLRQQDGDYGNGVGALTKAGTGTMVLSAANTYTGVTTISAGTLQIGDGTTDGSLAGTSIIDNATLAFAPIGTPTFAGVISGSGALDKSGVGSQTLTAVNTYSGATTVTGGSLILGGAGSLNNSSGITINGSGATFLQTSSTAVTPPITVTQGTLNGLGSVGAITVAAGVGNTVANGNGGSSQLTASSLALSGAATISLTPIGGATTATAPLVVGALTTSGTANTITINASPVTPFTVGQAYNLIQFTSFAGSASEFKAGPGFSARVIPTFGKTSNFITLTTTGDLPVWSGVNDSVWTTATNGNNAGPNNWATKTAHTATNFWASDLVEFNDTYTLGAVTTPVTRTTVDIATGGVSPASTTFNNSAIDYIIASPDAFGIAAGSLTKNGTGKVTLKGTNTYTGPTIITTGTLQIGDGTTDGSIASTASITNNGTLAYNLALAKTVTKVISGTGNLTTTAPDGTALTLTGANSFSGGITVNGGNLVAGNATALGAATNTLSFGATAGTKRLQLNGNSASLGGINSDSTAIIENGLSGTSVLTINSAVDSQFGGTIQNGAGTVALAKTGAAKLTLLGDNTYTGATTVTGGTLQVGNGVSVTGKLGNTAVGVSAGTLSLQTAGAFSQNKITLSGTGTVVETVNDAINGTAALDVGTSLTLSRPNSYTGDTTITANNVTLTVTDPAAIGTGRLHTSQGTTNYAFHFDGGGDFNLPNYLRNFGGPTINIDVNQNGDESEDGVVKLNGTSVLGDGGTTTVNVTGDFGYSLYLANVTNQGFHGHTVAFVPTTAPLTVGTFTSVHNGDLNATLRLDGTHTANFIGAITQSAADTPLTVTKAGTGTWTLTGTNSYTGPTNVNGGTLQIGNGGTTGDIPTTTTVNDNATLVFNRSDALAISNVISGTGAVTQTGAGTTTLSGANTYTGETAVNGGVLTIPTAFLSDTAAVRLGASGTLNLTFAGTDTVSAFSIDGEDMVAGTWGSLTSAAAHKTNRITGNGILNIPITSAYASWASLNGLTAGVNDGPTQDPDFDGISNVLEFVLNGNPLSSDTGKLPKSTLDATNIYFDFDRRDDSITEVALKFEYGTTLVVWPSSVAIPSDNTPVAGPPVTVTDNGDGITHHIQITVAKSSNPMLFGRLNAVK